MLFFIHIIQNVRYVHSAEPPGPFAAPQSSPVNRINSNTTYIHMFFPVVSTLEAALLALYILHFKLRKHLLASAAAAATAASALLFSSLKPLENTEISPSAAQTFFSANTTR